MREEPPGCAGSAPAAGGESAALKSARRSAGGSAEATSIAPPAPCVRIATCGRPAKAEVGSQHGGAVGEVAGAKADQVLGERAAGAQLLGGARLDRVAGADEHCGQRHSLGDHT